MAGVDVGAGPAEDAAASAAASAARAAFPAWADASPEVRADLLAGLRARIAVLGIVIPLCILYPLTGLSLLVAVGLDRAVAAIRKRVSAAV